MHRYFVVNMNTLCHQDGAGVFRLGSLDKITSPLTVMAHLGNPELVGSALHPEDIELIRLATNDDFKAFKVEGDYRFAVALQAKQAALPVDEMRVIAARLRPQFNMLSSDARSLEKQVGKHLDSVVLSPISIREGYALFCRHNQQATRLASIPEIMTSDGFDKLEDILGIIEETRLIRRLPISVPLPALVHAKKVRQLVDEYHVARSKAEPSMFDEFCYQVCASYQHINNLRGNLVRLKDDCVLLLPKVQELRKSRISMKQIHQDYGLLANMMEQKGEDLPPFFGAGMIEQDGWADGVMDYQSQFALLTDQVDSLISLYQSNGAVIR
ncbi:hypothetical protein ACTG16_23000 [Aeromonas sp. 23P]|uniref:hypothetical protein n=1 Tax=Aeromonas sp. 23P TaxID=3452716 RepID=UPI003F79F2AB